MMETVVTQGSGRWRNPGYRIAGKTGTAEKANIHGGGYYRGAKITSFIGIVPVESPLAMWFWWWMSRKERHYLWLHRRGTDC